MRRTGYENTAGFSDTEYFQVNAKTQVARPFYRIKEEIFDHPLGSLKWGFKVSSGDNSYNKAKKGDDGVMYCEHSKGMQD